MDSPKYATYNEFKKECRKELDLILLKQARLQEECNKSRRTANNSFERHKELAVQRSD